MVRKAWQAPGRTAKAATSDKTSGGKSTGSLEQGKPSDAVEDAKTDTVVAPLQPGLYIVATPIGHARDITLRALDVLRNVDLIAAEDTRVTSKLLAIYGIRKSLISYNDHSSDKDRSRLLEKVKGGARVAQVSDAGMPLVSDPGFRLVRAALAEGVAVECVPGASASLTALSLSGLPSDRFLFAGFLSAKAGERKTALEELKTARASLIFYEAPSRLADSLVAMAEILGDRDAAVCRELTKLHQEVRRGTLSELAADYTEAPRGEIAIVVGPQQQVGPDYARIDAALAKLIPFMPLKAASEFLADMLGGSKREIYDRGQKLKDAQS